MHAARERLPDRRASEGFDLEALGLRFHASVSRFADGRPAEIFIDAFKASSAADMAARDCAIATSLALPWGADAAVLRKAMCRDARGKAVGPVGIVLDMLAAEKGHAT
jgi:ribonucleoside-diphosphate reductase alpha chain